VVAAAMALGFEWPQWIITNGLVTDQAFALGQCHTAVGSCP
jgi:hypothetical protein